MDLGINGKTALVLGGAGGLGSAIAVSLCREGCNVAIADINATELDVVAKRLLEFGNSVFPHVWDITDLRAIDANLAIITKHLGPIDILVNNTGGPSPSSISGIDQDVWALNFGKMVQPVIAITDKVLADMRSKKWGRVITSASSGVIAPIPNLGVSNSLRSALVGWSKTLAREVAPHGITVNMLVPGRIATSRIQFLDAEKARREGRSIQDVAADSVASIPTGRYGTPEEYASVAAFLASSQASYVTGSIVRVDGGLIPSI